MAGLGLTNAFNSFIAGKRARDDDDARDEKRAADEADRASSQKRAKLLRDANAAAAKEFDLSQRGPEGLQPTPAAPAQPTAPAAPGAAPAAAAPESPGLGGVSMAAAPVAAPLGTPTPGANPVPATAPGLQSAPSLAGAHPAQPARPSVKPLAVVRALDAKGAVLLKGGDFQGFMENEAVAAGARLKARAGFLQQFEQDGDFDKLIRSSYATYPDDDEIVKVEPLKDGTGGAQGAPSEPDQVRITSKGGKVVIKPQQDFVEAIKRSLQDPSATAQQEAKIHYETLLAQAKADAEATGKIKVEKVKGDESRKTEVLKNEGDMGLENVRAKSREKTAGISANATLGSARIGADARRYAADKSAEASASRKAQTKAIDWTKRARESFGPQVNGALGGTRISDERMVALASAARAIHEANDGIDEEQALLAAAKELGIKSGGPPGASN